MQSDVLGTVTNVNGKTAKEQMGDMTLGAFKVLNLRSCFAETYFVESVLGTPLRVRVCPVLKDIFCTSIPCQKQRELKLLFICNLIFFVYLTHYWHEQPNMCIHLKLYSWALCLVFPISQIQTIAIMMEWTESASHKQCCQTFQCVVRKILV